MASGGAEEDGYMACSIYVEHGACSCSTGVPGNVCPLACGRCGKNPPEGFAEINGVRLCHGDTEDERGLTCYEATGIHNMQMRALAQIEDEYERDGVIEAMEAHRDAH